MDNFKVVTLDKLTSKQQKQRDVLIQEAIDDPFLGQDIKAPADYILLLDDVAVGFFSPYATKYKNAKHYRAGALYLTSAARGKGLMSRALTEYFQTHRPGLAWIEDSNHPSNALFKNLGFVKDKAKSYADWEGHYYVLK